MSVGHIRQRSTGSWEIRYEAPRGADRKRHVVTKTIRGSKKIARQALREAMGTVDRGEHVEPSRVTVADHVRGRIEHWHASGKIRTRTAENYTHVLAWIAAGLGSIAVQRLTTLDVERWHGELAGRGLAPRTVKVAHALLTRALADAVRHKVVARNAARDQGALSVKRTVADGVAPNAEQVAALLAKLAGDAWHVPVVVALYTGLRRGEQLALRWSAVDLDGRRLTVREALDESRAHGVKVKAPKSAAGARAISLPEVVIEALRQHRREQLERCLLLGLGRPSDDALVFPGPEGGHDIPSAFSNRWRRAAARLGVPETTWHGLRHAHASMLIGANVPITTVAARLGHADPGITLKVYSHLFAKDDSAAAAAIDRALG